MPDPVTGIVAGASVIGGISQSKAAGKAAKAQTQAADMGVAEQRAAREEMRQLLQPYTAAGPTALQGMFDLIGFGGEGYDPARQVAAIEGQAQNPLFQAIARQGEESILQNASATGGLRGGNTQGALAQFRPAMLDQFINQQYDRLAGIASLGQQSAAGVGAAGIQTGTNISSLLADAGAARAGGALAQGQAVSNIFGGIAGALAPTLLKRGF